MLFEPFSFAGFTLKNRIVRSATYEKRADEDGFVTDSLIELYETLARGGSGLIITGNALVHHTGRCLPQMLSIHSDIYIPGLRKLTEAVHRLDSLIIAQLNHGGRQCPPLLLGGQKPLAPSEVHDPATRATPKAMTNTEIWDIIDAFGEAARRAQLSGFDAVQIHAAHGYLISSFLSPHTNRRDDYWGGDEERRFHFIEEVYKAVREAVGEHYPVFIKINCDDLLPGGITLEESVKAVSRLQAMGLDAVEISGGMRESQVKTIRPDILAPEDEAYFRNAGKLFRQTLGIPVILTGGMRSKTVMEDVLAKGQADLIGMSRPLIREPALPALLKEGKEKADCISCNKCIRFSRLSYVRCKQIKHTL
jgi:2,4-dienoyl-CoA reductase-like NADH-dependent reductase (Old Yellow Enzyme family)